MTTRWEERVFSWLTRVYPRAFRQRYGDDLLAFFRQDWSHPKYGSGRLRPYRFWMSTVRDLASAAVDQRRERRGATAVGGGRTQWPKRIGQDLRFAWRGLWAVPGLTLSALAVLTLGIGAATSIFSVVDGVVLRGLPFPEDDRLVSIAETTLATGRPSTVRPQNYFDWRDQQHVFETIGAFNGRPMFVTRNEPVEALRQVEVTATLFDVLRVRPAIGRPFSADDERQGASPVLIISDRLWRRRFHADPAILSRTMATGRGEVPIVGVMPPGFSYPLPAPVVGGVDMWAPFVPTPDMTVHGRTNLYTLSVVARLKPGVAVEDAARQMSQIRDVLERRDSRWQEKNGVLVLRLQDAIVSAPVRSWMLLLLGAVTVVMLMACLNAANLLLARSSVRAPEFAVRAALGATRWDIARSLLVESLVLSLVSAAAGVLLAGWGVDILRSAMPEGVPRIADVALDLRVLSVAIFAAVVTGVVFGTIPALQASRPDLVTLLSHAGRSGIAGARGRRFRSGLIVAEVAFAVVLLAGAGLFLSSFVRVTTVPLGFDPRHVVAFLGGVMDSSTLKPAKTPEKRAAAKSGQSVVAAALERVRAIPGVAAVTAMQGGRPLEGSWISVPVEPVRNRGRGPSTMAFGSLESAAPGQDEPVVRSVGPEYLDVLRGTLWRGRWIAPTDVDGSLPVVVLSDRAAQRYFGADDPVGERLLMDGYERTVVGVVAAMRWRGPESEIAPEAFVPFQQSSNSTAQLLVRTQGDPGPLLPAIEAAIHTDFPSAVFAGPWAPEPLERSYDGLIARRRFNMIVLSVFGVAGLAIAAVGIYGLMAFLVEQRRREIGVRVALGAERSRILSLVLGRAVRLLLAGLVPGLVAALLLERTAMAFLFQAQPHDPALYALVASVLLMCGLAAAFGPARKAMRMDPLQALRLE